LHFNAITFTLLSKAWQISFILTFFKADRNISDWKAEKELAKRKDLESPWECSRGCGFKSWDIAEVVEHENKTRC